MSNKKIFSSVLIRLFCVLFISTWGIRVFAKLSQESWFFQESLLLLTDNSPHLSLDRLLEILESGAQPSEPEKEFLDRLTEVAFAEGLQFKEDDLSLLEEKLKRQKLMRLASPLVMLSSHITISQIWGPDWWVHLSSLAIGGVFLTLQQHRDPVWGVNSKVVKYKQQIVASILLARLQIRYRENSEGFPWPFSAQPQCNILLSDSLSKYKLN